VKCLAWLILILLFSGGCAQPPRTELAAARGALAQAYAAGACRLAADDYRIAASALRDSESLVDAGNYRQARELLPFATLRARRALVLALGADETSRRDAAERRNRALAAARQQQPQPPPPPHESPPPAPAPRPPPVPLSTYTVAAGDTLWTIAAQPQVYNDPLLWPLLYKANRDQIRDPRQVYSGQVLSIPRDLSPADLEEARQKARTSDIFPLEQLLPAAPPRGH
jgi:LysM domain